MVVVDVSIDMLRASPMSLYKLIIILNFNERNTIRATSYSVEMQ
jgi:hypothetical protein